MKVYVTQGHEKGVGLEVFFKSCLMLSREQLQKIKLLGYEASIFATLRSLRLPFAFQEGTVSVGGVSVDCEWLGEENASQSFASLELGMKLAESGGILFTLPTSKDQFPGYPGHTEYFRAFYRRPDLGMFFSSPLLQVLLISDHLAVNALSETLTEELVYRRLLNATTTLDRWGWPVKRILIAGLNPHAGENGLIGNEDERIARAVNRLRSKTRIPVAGPFPGDTMLLEKTAPDDLLVYLFHDQGLGVFKGLQGFVGSNITLGLPYPRFGPDHGTSFSLYGRNVADHRGCEFSLKQALTMLERMSYGKNPGHKGTGSQS